MDERIEELAREKLEGKSYSEIRTALSEEGLSENEISQLIRKVDERVLEETVRSGSKTPFRQWYNAGLVLALAGLALSVVFNAGLILRNFPAMAVYSPFLAGILLMFYARMMQRRGAGRSEKGTGAIRKKRPYK
jgi:hypothetical protein